MRSTGDRLENKFIVPIARELAIALKAIHDGGIIHRDIKGMVFNILGCSIAEREIFSIGGSNLADMKASSSRKCHGS